MMNEDSNNGMYERTAEEILRKHTHNVALLDRLTEWHWSFVLKAMEEYALTRRSSTVESKSEEWISVKERLPETDGAYLCIYRGKRKILWFGMDSDWSDLHLKTYYWPHWFLSEKAYNAWDSLDTEPTHWQPLPKAPLPIPPK